jgi:hypothetical protein
MRLSNWLVVFGAAYLEYTTWNGNNFYRRTVGYDSVVWC